MRAKRYPIVSLSANDDWFPEINVLPFFFLFSGVAGGRLGCWAELAAGGSGNAPLGGVDTVKQEVLKKTRPIPGVENGLS